MLNYTDYKNYQGIYTRNQTNLISFNGAKKTNLEEITEHTLQALDAAEKELGIKNGENGEKAKPPETFPNININDAKSIISQRVKNFTVNVDSAIYYDGMTGILNRKSYDRDRVRLLKESVIKKENIGLICFDLDKFGDYNREFGHPEGDKALKVYANVLKEAVGEEGKVYRYGGEEIFAFIPNASYERVGQIAEKARASLEDTSKKAFLDGELKRKLTVSAGYDLFKPAKNLRLPENPQKLRECFKRTMEALEHSADKTALFAAKNSGRNRVQGAREISS